MDVNGITNWFYGSSEPTISPAEQFEALTQHVLQVTKPLSLKQQDGHLLDILKAISDAGIIGLPASSCKLNYLFRGLQLNLELANVLNPDYKIATDMFKGFLRTKFPDNNDAFKYFVDFAAFLFGYSDKVEAHMLKKAAVLGFIRSYIKQVDDRKLKTEVDEMVHRYPSNNTALAELATDYVKRHQNH